ncbi:MAG: hypothetical protein LUB59_01080 [Candidatus Gastranaerophilales bacterium]|nr:hypothetical protein [Candidatus Gastranaerophilales bacterium]
MEKSYETYANKFKTLISEFEEETKKIENTANQIAIDRRFTDFGRQEHITGLKADLEKLRVEYTDILRGLVKQFCEEYAVSFSEDGADHGTDIANALKVIEMCGANITPDLFRSVVDPLKGSYKALKVISDVLTIRWENQPLDDKYDKEIRGIILDYMGSDVEVNSYVEYLNDVKAVTDYPVLLDYQLVNVGVNGASRFEVRNQTRYSVCVLPDEIIRMGRMYEELTLKCPLLFKNQVTS